jgi:hypothetical protein
MKNSIRYAGSYDTRLGEDSNIINNHSYKTLRTS